MPARPPRSAELLAAAAGAREQLRDTGGEGDELGLIHFDLGGDHFAIPVEAVSNIERFPAITPVPNTPFHVRGIANLRGEIVPVLDLIPLLDIEQHEGHADRGLLVLRDDRKRFGVVTGSLPDYIRVSPDRVEPAPKSNDAVDGILAGAIRLVDRSGGGSLQRLVGVIDSARLMALVARTTNAE